MGARRTRVAALAALALAPAGCERAPTPAAGPQPPARDPQPWFVERAAATGLDFVHHNGSTGGLLLAEITCGGGALFDYDGDGDLDAYLVQGGTLDRTRAPVADAPAAGAVDAGRPASGAALLDRLYRNDLDRGSPDSLRFTDVTARALGAKSSYGCAVAVGDYDRDGRPDLYLANLGANRLLHNDGERGWSDVTEEAGVGEGGSSTTALFFDYDRDGWLDLFVGNYVTFDHAGSTACRSPLGAPDYCAPRAFPYEQGHLYHNRGGKVFEDVTVAAGLARHPSPTLGAVAADFDGDGWTDLYVANDGEPNFLWRNRRDGTFVETAQLAGCAVNAEGRAQASMGVDAGDFDADGDLDLFMTHLIGETNTLYRNAGDGSFADYTSASGLGPPSLPFTSFGTRFLDYDNDGWLDLLVVSGAVTLLPELVAAGDPFPLHQTKQLFRNLGAANGEVRFADVTESAGDSFDLSDVSRGAAFGDVDDDGDTDVLVANNGGPARLLVNQLGNRNLWVGVRLVGGDPPTDRIGAVASLLRGGRAGAVRRAATDGSYASASDPRIVFGLGADAEYDGFRVAWPDGSVEEFAPVPIGRYVTLRQGDGERPNR